jgi:SAM-dependent methyltransferase
VTEANGHPRRPYRFAARYYKARPPYSAELQSALAARLGWNGAGRLLDVGCGIGVIAFALASSFAEVIGLDPEEAMLDQARAAGLPPGAKAIKWVKGTAEDIPDLNLGAFRAVTLAQSFHWTEKERVANVIHHILEPGGALILIHHEPDAYQAPERFPPGPPHPPIPHEVINAALTRYLGRGKPPHDPHREPYGELLARTPFGAPSRLILPGRRDLVRSVEDVIDNYLSTSFAAPDLFGDRLDDFRVELAAALAEHTNTGFFWEWPGDTELLIALKGK